MAAKRGKSRKIALDISDQTLKKDLADLKQEALDLGATSAEIIPASMVEIDDRVRLKCFSPLCTHYDKCQFCPPHVMDLDSVRRALSKFSWAVLLKLDVVPPSEFADRAVQREAAAKWTAKVNEIVGGVETLAFGMGYYLAVGFSQGSCRTGLCKQERCRVLEGENCPYPLKARPSMEAMGIDVFRLVTKVGWEIYPIYRSVDPQQVPHAIAAGIVFVY